jgi:hypothetical protein
MEYMTLKIVHILIHSAQILLLFILLHASICSTSTIRPFRGQCYDQSFISKQSCRDSDGLFQVPGTVLSSMVHYQICRSFISSFQYRCGARVDELLTRLEMKKDRWWQPGTLCGDRDMEMTVRCDCILWRAGYIRIASERRWSGLDKGAWGNKMECCTVVSNTMSGF